jgi:hypothetical protein
MNRLWVVGGYVAGAAILAIGIACIVIGASGRSEVRHDLTREKIQGTPDMKTSTPLPSFVTDKPDCDVAGKDVKTGADAKCFASYIRVHTLEATQGKTYAEMPRFAGKTGQPTNDETQAAIDPKSKKPVDNPARQIWVTSTALSTALHTSFFAESVSTFVIVIGAVLVLAGIGFLVLAAGVLRPLSGRSRSASGTAGQVATPVAAD